MKDAIALLAAGILFSLFSWVFWHYLGSEAPAVIVTVVLVIVMVDNARLRRQLRKNALDSK